MKNYHPKNINEEQSAATGMAIVLIFILIGLYKTDFIYIKISTVCLVLNMISPAVFKYAAVIWLGGSQFIGTYVSKVLLTLVYLIIVIPIGLLRNILGFDSLNLKKFKLSNASVMSKRELSYTNENINKPY